MQMGLRQSDLELSGSIAVPARLGKRGMSEDGTKHQHLLNDPSHWRKRAAEAREIADHMSDPEARQMMLKVADGYDRIARRVAARSAG